MKLGQGENLNKQIQRIFSAITTVGIGLGALMLLGPLQQGTHAPEVGAAGAIVPANESAQVKQAGDKAAQTKADAAPDAQAQAQVKAVSPGAALLRVALEEAILYGTDAELSPESEQAYQSLEAACGSNEFCTINSERVDLYGRASFDFTKIESAVDLCEKVYARAQALCKLPQISSQEFEATMEQLHRWQATPERVHALLRAIGELIPQERMHTMLPPVVFAIREFGKQMQSREVALTLELEFYRRADLRDRAMDLMEGQVAEFRAGVKRETEIPWAAFAAFLWSVGDQEEAIAALQREIAILETGTSRQFGRSLASDKLLSTLNARLQSWQSSMNCVASVQHDGKDRVLVLSTDCGS